MKRIVKVILGTTVNMAFTIAGMVIVQLTLSGDTQRIAGYANGAALLATYGLAIYREFKHGSEET
jgi:hypothetical protein